MEFSFFCWPVIEIDTLLADDRLDVEFENQGCKISFKGEKYGLILYTDMCPEDEPSKFAIQGYLYERGGELLRYIVESQELFILAVDSLFGMVDEFETRFAHLEYDDEVREALFADCAAGEMLCFAEEYGWSEAFVERLKTMRKEAREKLGLKESYSLGETVRLDGCGPDMSCCATGQIIYVDDCYAIAHVPCYTYMLATGLNRQTLSSNEVEEIVGHSIDTIKENEHDVFVDMMNPLSYYPSVL